MRYGATPQMSLGVFDKPGAVNSAPPAEQHGRGSDPERDFKGCITTKIIIQTALTTQQRSHQMLIRFINMTILISVSVTFIIN